MRFVKKFEAEILFDFTWFQTAGTDKNYTQRPFELGVFNVDCKPACDEDLKLVIDKDERNFIEKFFKKSKKNVLRQRTAYVFEKNS